jgi:hypothetical protein
MRTRSKRPSGPWSPAAAVVGPAERPPVRRELLRVPPDPPVPVEVAPAADAALAVRRFDVDDVAALDDRERESDDPPGCRGSVPSSPPDDREPEPRLPDDRESLRDPDDREPEPRLPDDRESLRDPDDRDELAAPDDRDRESLPVPDDRELDDRDEPVRRAVADDALPLDPPPDDESVFHLSGDGRPLMRFAT